MPEEKYLRYVPNAKHNLAGSDARESMLAFYESIVKDTKRPTFGWEMKEDGSIRVTVEDRPHEVNLWQATNPDGRDFRLDTIGKAWTSTPIKPDHALYVGNVAEPDKGFTAFFVFAALGEVC